MSSLTLLFAARLGRDYPTLCLKMLESNSTLHDLRNLVLLYITNESHIGNY
jgi:hypothetical protein